MPAQNILIVGATRGLGASLVKQYSASNNVYATSRSTPKDSNSNKVKWIADVDVAEPTAGKTILKGLDGAKIDLLILNAGYLAKESFDELDFEKEIAMFKISCVGPLFIVQHLVKTGALGEGSKIIMITSEGGSITLRHESETSHAYGHHSTKCCANMIGRLLSIDLKDRKILVCMVHPGFMKTEMTRGAGFDKFWDEGGAVTPDEAASILMEFIAGLNMTNTGQFWAPRGPIDIGTIEQTVGLKKDLSTPLQLPW